MEWVLSTTCSDSEDDTAQEVDECLDSADIVNLSRENATPDIKPKDLKNQKPMEISERESVTLDNFGKSAKERQSYSSTASGISSEKEVVCKHWLRGVCKKGDQCLYLHEYDPTKMPVCYYYSRLGKCVNQVCRFLHSNTESKNKDSHDKPEILTRRQQIRRKDAARKMKKANANAVLSQVSEVVIKVEKPEEEKPEDNEIPGANEECVGSSTDPACSQWDQTQDGEEPLSCSEDQEIYKCKDCNLKFKTLLSLNSHLRSEHIMVGSFKCTSCNEHFPDAGSASNHWSMIHNFCKLYQCTECNLMLKSEKALSQHQSSYHGTTPSKCSQCFSLKSRLKQHLWEVHNTRKLSTDVSEDS